MDHITTLEMAGQLISQPDIKKKNAKACALLEEGSLLENALSDSELFQGMEARLITVGLRAGSADEVMNRLAQRYRDSSLTVTGNLISIVEPTLCDHILCPDRSGPPFCNDAAPWSPFRYCNLR